MCILSLGHDFVSSIHVLPTLSYRHQKQHRAGYYQYPDLRMTDSEGRSVYSTHTGQLIYLLISSHGNYDHSISILNLTENKPSFYV